MGGGYITDASLVPGSREPNDTAETRVTIDSASGCERLEQRVITFDPGRSRPRSSGDRQEVLYVASGRGTIELEGTPYPVEPDTGVYIRPGETYAVENTGPDPLLMVSVTAPA